MPAGPSSISLHATRGESPRDPAPILAPRPIEHLHGGLITRAGSNREAGETSRRAPLPAFPDRAANRTATRRGEAARRGSTRPAHRIADRSAYRGRT